MDLILPLRTFLCPQATLRSPTVMNRFAFQAFKPYFYLIFITKQPQ